MAEIDLGCQGFTQINVVELARMAVQNMTSASSLVMVSVVKPALLLRW